MGANGCIKWGFFVKLYCPERGYNIRGGNRKHEPKRICNYAHIENLIWEEEGDNEMTIYPPYYNQ